MGLSGTMPSAFPKLDDIGGWPEIFRKLAASRDLSQVEAYAALAEIWSGEAKESQIGAFLLGLRQKKETAEEMVGLTKAMLAFAEKLEIAGDSVDTCGTGGDRSGSVNVSTIAAFVVAGAGVAVVKHGNRAASSKAGSADVLGELGVAVDLPPAAVKTCVEEVGMGFCFAPRFHPAMRFAIPVRQALGIPTVFNFLGPLANPARVPFQVVGVSDQAMGPKMALVLRSNGVRRALVVYGHDGLDEISTTAPSTIIEVSANEIRSKVYDVDPVDFGIGRARLEDLKGGDAKHNAQCARAVLAGEKGPHRDIAVVNAAAALLVSGAVGSFEEGIQVASESIDSRKAAGVWDGLAQLSTRLAAESQGS